MLPPQKRGASLRAYTKAFGGRRPAPEVSKQALNTWNDIAWFSEKAILEYRRIRIDQSMKRPD
jgi:hypothetical protein